MLLRKRSIIKTCMIIGVSAVLLGGCVSTDSYDNCEVIFKINGNDFKGTYIEESTSEDMKMFQTVDKDQNIAKVQGTVKNGVLSGTCVLTYLDGSEQTGTMKKGNWDGKTVWVDSNGTTRRIYYKNGEPMGRILIESSDGQRQQDWYYNGVLLSEWVQKAKSYEYRDYYSEIYTYYDECVSVSGQIQKIFKDGDKQVIKIKDDAGNKYYISYNNGIYKKEKVVIMPSVQAGEKITVYGFFKGLMQSTYKNEDEDDYGFSFPEISALYGTVDENEYDVYAVPVWPCEYEDIIDNPYCFVNTKVEITGVIENVYRNDDLSTYYCRVNSNQDIYYIKLDLKELIGSTLPVAGDQISVNGNLYGNYCQKEYDGKEVVVSTFPLINNPKFELK